MARRIFCVLNLKTRFSKDFDELSLEEQGYTTHLYCKKVNFYHVGIEISDDEWHLLDNTYRPFYPLPNNYLEYLTWWTNKQKNHINTMINVKFK